MLVTGFLFIMRFLLILFLFCPLLTFTQSKPDEIFTLKPALGINGCQVNGDNYSGYNKVGAFGGIAVNALLKERFSLELGFFFSQKGSRHNPKPDKGDITYYRVHFNYIDLPLLFRYQLNQTYFITLGPSISYLISYKEENQYGKVSNLPFNKFDLGGSFGLGRKIKERFFIEVRIYNSFKPIRNYGLFGNNIYYPGAATRFFKPGLYNNVLSFIFSYQLNTKKRSGSQS